MNDFFKELKRRNVYKVALTYAIVAWLIIQIGSLVFDTINAPHWVMQALLFFVIIGFPIALILAWAFEMSPQGMIRTSSAAAEENPYPINKKKPLTSNLFIGVLTLIIIGQFAYNKYSDNDSIAIDSMAKSIAVLPFDDMSSGGDTEWFCDGITEDILTHLSKIKSIRVISRTSVMQYKKSGKTIPEIARELGVTHIVEGSVRKHDNNVLITAQLIKANDEHLWADSFNEKMDNVFKIQSDVAKKIVAQLKISISPEEEKILDKKPTESPEAYELVLKGRAIKWDTKDNHIKAIDYFKQAITLDKNYADAYAEIGARYINLTEIGAIDYGGGRKEAKSFIDKSIEIDPNNEIGYYVLTYYYRIVRDYANAKKVLDKAIQLNPNSGELNSIYSQYYILKDIINLEKHLEHARIAQQLEPFNSFGNIELIRALLKNKKVLEAESHYNKMKFTIDSIQYSTLERDILIYKNKDWTVLLNYRKKLVEKDMSNFRRHWNLAFTYQIISHDVEKSLFHYKKALELSPPNYRLSNEYFYSILYAKDFLKANELLNDPKFMDVFNGDRKNQILFDFYYYQGAYEKSLEYLDKFDRDSHYYWNLAAVNANMENTELVYELLNKHIKRYSQRAVIFANLKERDSMYFYLNKIESINRARGINQYPEYEPYRNEPRFKDFLKKNYLPVSTE